MATLTLAASPWTGKGGYDIFVAQYKASNGAHLWSKVLGGTGHDYGYGLAADSSGNIIVIGHFLGIASFGGTSLTSKGSYDGFIAQFKANGQHIWSKNFGGTSQDYARGVTVDGSGNITVTGSYSGSANFGGATLTSKGSYDLFMAQYKSGGQHVWSKAFGSTANDNGLALAADSSGNITLTGVIYSNTSLGGATLGNKGAWDVFVARYKANGQHIWSRAHGGVGSDYSSAVAVDSSGNSTVVGKFSEIVNFGYGAEAGYNTLFMANYAP